MAASTTTTTPPPSPGKRSSTCKRKPPPITITDTELLESRYPPFDFEDPFASLTELRRRQRSNSYTIGSSYPEFQNSTNEDINLWAPTGSGGTTSSDVPLSPHLSEKAFPRAIARRYTLDVALPEPGSSFFPFDTFSVDRPFGPSGLTHENRSADQDRQEALNKLTTRSNMNVRKTVSCEKSIETANKNTSSNADGGRDHHDHQRRYSHIAMLFRDSTSRLSPQNGRKPRTKSHYIPRKASTLSYMYSRPPTPELSAGSSSGSVSSSSSYLEPSVFPSRAQTPQTAEFMDKPIVQTSTSAKFVKKLWSRRSLASLTSLRGKQSMDLKELPPLPTTPIPRPERAPTIPYFRDSALASISDTTLPNSNAASPKKSKDSSPVKDTPPPSMKPSPTRTEKGSQPKLPQKGSDSPDSVWPPSKRGRLFSFNSCSMFKSRVDLYECKKVVSEPQFSEDLFNEYYKPNSDELQTIGSLPVITESGLRIRFGDLWARQKTLIVFIRHFRASACQDYVRSVASEVDIEALERAGLKIVLIGLGPHHLITPYKHLTQTPFPVYTDPTLSIHKALGMNLRTTDPGPDSECGYYVGNTTATTHNGGPFGFGHSLSRLRHKLATFPLFERAGDPNQLGGEFVLGPDPARPGSEVCTFAHRMRNTRAHAPVLDVISASGVYTAGARRIRNYGSLQGRRGGHSNRESMEDEDAWMARRRRSLMRLRRKRQCRRAGGADAASIANSFDDRSTLDLPERKKRVSVVEEEGEEGDFAELYSSTHRRQYDLHLTITQ